MFFDREAAKVFDDCCHGHGDIGAAKALVISPPKNRRPDIGDRTGHVANCRGDAAGAQPGAVLVRRQLTAPR